MFEPIASPKRLERVTACRRRGRAKLQVASVTCWSEVDSPRQVPAIEADLKGARLMLPWDVAPGQQISVAVGDELGQFSTRRARIVWTEKLESTGRVVAGVAFDYELALAV